MIDDAMVMKVTDGQMFIIDGEVIYINCNAFSDTLPMIWSVESCPRENSKIQERLKNSKIQTQKFKVNLERLTER